MLIKVNQSGFSFLKVKNFGIKLIESIQQKLSSDSGELSIKFVCPQFSAFNKFMLSVLKRELTNITCGFYTKAKQHEEKNLCQLINIFRSLNNASFSLKYKNMNEQTLSTLLTEKDFMPSQPKSEFKGFRFLDKEMLSSQLKNPNELAILAAVGIQHILILDEERLVPWKSIIMVSCLAGVQIAGGIACLGFGCVNVGLALISEGVGDTFLAVNIYRKREFRMRGFLTRKVVSVAFSMITLGVNVGGAVNSAVTAENMARQGAQEVLERVGQQVMTNLSKYAVKGGQVALVAVSKEAVSLVINEGANVIEARIKEVVRHSIRDKLETCLKKRSNEEFRKCIHKLIAFDYILEKKQRTHALQSTLDKIEVTTPITNILKCCAPLLDTLSIFNETFGKLAKCLSIAQAVASATELYTFLDEKLITKFIEEVKNLNNSNKISKVLSECLNITNEKSEEICFHIGLSNDSTLDLTKFDWESKQRMLKAGDAHLMPKLKEFFQKLKLSMNNSETALVLHNLIIQSAERLSDTVYEIISEQYIEPVRTNLNKGSLRMHDTKLLK
jgi:hypothetical protein